MAATAALAATATGLAGLAGVLIFVAVTSAMRKSWDYVPVRNIDSYEEVLDLAIREAKGWKSPQKSDEATMPMEQGINKENELMCQVSQSPERSDEATMPMEQGINKENELMCQGSHFNLVKPYPFQSDVV